MNSSFIKENSLSNESGSALIAVLSLIALASVLTVSSITFANKTSYLSESFYQKAFTSYAAEGASARIQWLISSDRRKYPQRTLGVNTSIENKQNSIEVRFIADGVWHSVNYYGMTVNYRITDLASGIDIGGPDAIVNLQSFASQYEGDKREAYVSFINKFEDYTDNNDLVRLNSLESDSYRALNLYPLPRNSRMEFKEELLWIPGALEFFPPDDKGKLSLIRLIPPQNMPRPSSANSFFSTDMSLVSTLAGLSEDESSIVNTAREKWINEGIDLSLSLDVGLMTKLRSKFSFIESGYYTIDINTAAEDSIVSKKLVISGRISSRFTNPGIRYYQYFSY
ncbi:MAG TPA: hypothetical protein P5105_04165 [Victivallales bacterium]|nr:hypothetical protein [Victivallales bacterium]